MNKPLLKNASILTAIEPAGLRSRWILTPITIYDKLLLSKLFSVLGYDFNKSSGSSLTLDATIMIETYNQLIEMLQSEINDLQKLGTLEYDAAAIPSSADLDHDMWAVFWAQG